MRILLTFFAALMLFSACRHETYVPRPRQYPRIDTPAHAYKTFDSAGFPYRFEIPEYSYVSRDSAVTALQGANPYWINIEIPRFAGRIYLSYKTITPAEPIDTLLKDAYKMSEAHEKKASYMNSPTFTNRYGVNGMVYEVGGDAASAYQFFATDNTKHFLRGSLYFDVSPNADSLAPVIRFLKQDLDHLLGTLQWK